MSKKNADSNILNENPKKTKIIIVVVILVIIVLFIAYQYLFGCFKIPIISQYRDETKLSNELVSISANKMSKTGTTIILTNNSDYEISYGYGSSSLEIEHSMFNNWFMMLPKRNISTLAIGKIVKPKESVEITYDWKDKYGSLSPGRYRIVIDLIISNVNDSRIIEKYKGSFVSCEFNI